MNNGKRYTEDSKDSVTTTILKDAPEIQALVEEQTTPAVSIDNAACSCDVDNDVSVASPKTRYTKQRICRTAVLYTGVFILGMQWGIIGPSLPDLELVTGGNTTYISLILTGRNIAALVGSVLAGVLVDRYNTWLLLGLAEIMLGVLFAVAPSGRGLVVLGLGFIPSGIAAGFYDTGVNVAVIRVWANTHGKPGPWIQAMEFIDAVGSAIAPLLVQPFLALKPTNLNPWIEEAELSYNQSAFASIQVMTGTTGELSNTNPERENNLTLFMDVNSSVSAYNFQNNTEDYFISSRLTSNVFFAYLIVGILLFAAAFAHFAVFFQGKCVVKVPRTSKKEDILKQSMEKDKSSERKLRCLAMFSLFIICFSYYSLETGYAHYLMTFSVTHLKWEKTSGVALTTAYWLAYIIGTAIGIFLVKFVQPQTLLIFDITLCLSAQIILVIFIHWHYSVIWICTIASGFSAATIFASVFSWAQTNIGVTGKVNSLLMMGMSLGEMTSPAVIGSLMEMKGPIWWVYCMVSGAVLCVLGLVGLLVLEPKLKKTCTLQKTVISVDDEEEELQTCQISDVSKDS